MEGKCTFNAKNECQFGVKKLLLAEIILALLMCRTQILIYYTGFGKR